MGSISLCFANFSPYEWLLNYQKLWNNLACPLCQPRTPGFSRVIQLGFQILAGATPIVAPIKSHILWHSHTVGSHPYSGWWFQTVCWPNLMIPRNFRTFSGLNHRTWKNPRSSIGFTWFHLVSPAQSISWPGQVVVKRVSFPAYDRRETCENPISGKRNPCGS